MTTVHRDLKGVKGRFEAGMGAGCRSDDRKEQGVGKDRIGVVVEPAQNF